MRHRKRGRVLGRSPSHRKAMLKNLASALFLTERETDPDLDENIPKNPGRIVTTLHKAKEVRPLVEKCITIARKSLKHEREAEQFSVDAERNTDQWRSWRQSDQWQQWNQAIAPAVAARRRALQLLGDKHAVSILFDDIAPRFEDRPGGYTRILKLAKPRLGDAGAQAILEFVGENDRVKKTSERPSFEDEAATEVAEEEVVDEAADTSAESEPSEEASAEASDQEGGEAKEDDDKEEK